MPSALLGVYTKSYRSYARWSLRKKGYLEFLDRRPTGAFAPAYDDLQFLYRLIRKVHPNFILEFGSGCSTVVMAYALRDNGHGRLHSVDVDPVWTDVTRRTVPEDLRQIVTITCSLLEDITLFGVPGCRHRELPEAVPDFVYLDGPPLSDGRRAAFDMLDLEAHLSPGFTMVVDSRHENVRVLERHFRRSFKVTRRPLFHNTVFELLA